MKLLDEMNVNEKSLFLLNYMFGIQGKLSYLPLPLLLNDLGGFLLQESQNNKLGSLTLGSILVQGGKIFAQKSNNAFLSFFLSINTFIRNDCMHDKVLVYFNARSL